MHQTGPENVTGESWHCKCSCHLLIALTVIIPPPSYYPPAGGQEQGCQCVGQVVGTSLG